MGIYGKTAQDVSPGYQKNADVFYHPPMGWHKKNLSVLGHHLRENVRKILEADELNHQVTIYR